MKYIIMCGGPRNYKPLWTVYNEQLVERTIRLLKMYGIEDIAISSNNPAYDKFGVPVLHHKNWVKGRKWHWLHCFYRTEEPVCYLMGDVFYSPYAIRTIIGTETDDIEFFASAPPFNSRWYIKNHAEPFAYKVQDVEHFWKCVRRTLWYNSRHYFHREAITWELWQVIKGTPLNQIDYTNYVAINDYTVDIDSAEEIRRLEKRLKRL